MAFKDRISGMFRFGGKGAKDKTETEAVAEAEEAHLPAPATAEEREELIQELGDGFSRVGNVLERLDQNLGAGVRSLEAVHQAQEQLPVLITEQHNLIREALDHASVTRNALQSLADHLNQRDEAQKVIVDRLEQLGTTMRDQQDHHDKQLQLVMSFHRSSRFMTAMLVLGAFLLIVLLLGTLMAVIANPTILGGGQATAAPAPAAPATVAPAADPTAQLAPPDPVAPVAAVAMSEQDQPNESARESTHIATLIEEAKASDNPTIANRAKAAE